MSNEIIFCALITKIKSTFCEGRLNEEYESTEQCILFYEQLYEKLVQKSWINQLHDNDELYLYFA